MRIYVSLGSNIGDRAAHLRNALEALQRRKHIRVTAVSKCYETDPVGVTDQARFYNIAAEIETALGPLEFLNVVKDIERALGRTPSVRWGPREIDIDLILWGPQVIDLPNLTVPHHSFRERAFVLVPLADIAPDCVDPVTGRTVKELLEIAPRDGQLEPIDTWIAEPPCLEPNGPGRNA